jgi:sulfur-oxidizing protein SoxZ
MGECRPWRLRNRINNRMSSIKIRTQALAEATEIRLLINHPMENGRNRDPLSGELIPAHFIQEIKIYLNDALLMQADMAGSIAKNPYFSFRLKKPAGGARLRITWSDNQHLSDSAEYTIPD